ncbi:MAG: N-acetylmuramoyl-L-alanine amidase, partial [Lachnospiraceae bacterium]|nr:N-acetylmuramoyl-L-alanine amidase [Lachnospiraceae bacterium]
MVFLAAKYGTVQVVSAEVAERNGRPVVVIDSGHGGNDPGKVGVDGSLEKEINLEIAMRLKQYLELEDIEVIMTRESDTGLYQEGDTSKKTADMRNRCRLINDAKPDLVVSIH